MITNVKDVKKLGTILCIGAHPDDETFIAGGLLAAATQNGQRVVCITATKGEAGVQDEMRWPKNQLANIRRLELEAALKVLGIKEHYWLDYEDGGCADQNQSEAVDKLKAIVAEVMPDSILTFGPDGLTGHTDHVAVGQWAKLAAGDATLYQYSLCTDHIHPALLQIDQKMNIFFNLEKPPIKPHDNCAVCFEPNDQIWSKKYDALLVMPSQTEKTTDEFSEQKLRQAWAHESFIRIK